MRKLTVGSALLFLAVSAASAQEGIYVGIGLGNFEFDETFVDPILERRLSDSMKSSKLFGGFEFNDNLAMEVTYAETSDSTISGNLSPPNEDVRYTLTADYSYTSLKALGRVPFDWGMLLGGLGYFRSDYGYREQLVSGSDSLAGGGTISDEGLSLMLGIEWRFGRFGTHYGFRLEYETFELEATDVSVAGLSFSYGF